MDGMEGASYNFLDLVASAPEFHKSYQSSTSQDAALNQEKSLALKKGGKRFFVTTPSATKVIKLNSTCLWTPRPLWILCGFRCSISSMISSIQKKAFLGRPGRNSCPLVPLNFERSRFYPFLTKLAARWKSGKHNEKMIEIRPPSSQRTTVATKKRF